MKLASFAAMISLAVIATAKPWNVVTAGSQSSESRDQTAEKQLMDLERKGYQEGLVGNTSAALATVSSDFVGWDSGIWDGKVHWVLQDKDALAKDINSGKGTFESITVDELQARVHGTTGAIRGWAVFKRKDAGGFEIHFLDTWEKSHNGWILLAGATVSQQTQ